MESDSFTSERFRVVRWLGRGATGDVYEAFDRERNAQVAIKALRYMNPHAIARFKHEFRGLQDVHHPNLMALGELHEERGQLFFTMELVRGVDFLSYVRREGAPEEFALCTTQVHAARAAEPPRRTRDTGRGDLDDGRLRAVLREVSRGLLALHEMGKVHRDVKPSNILVDTEGRVVILDFGLLVDADYGDTWSGQGIVGTPHYMAPEQAAGQPAEATADWYSVGVMLYEALTGQLPHDGPVMQVLIDKQRREPPPVSSLTTDAPADLARLCAKLLRIDPARRPTGVDVLRVLDGRPPRLSRPPQGTLTQAPIFVGRHDELTALHAAYQASIETRRPQVVLIEGDSGLGKSTLMRAFLRAVEADAFVVPGRCFERESVAFKAFDDVVESLARLLVRLDPALAAAMLPLHAALLCQVFPSLKRVRAFADAPATDVDGLPHGGQRARLFAALRELLTRLAQRRPLVIAIDDLHWADDDSLAMMAEVLRAPAAPPVLWVATLRQSDRDLAAGPGPGVAARIRDIQPDARTIELAPLDEAASRELARRLAAVHGLGGGSYLDAIAREAAGHPLFLDALVRDAVASGGRLAGALPLADALWARVQALDPMARAIVECVSVASGQVVQEIVARAADVPAERFAACVSTLRAANLVRTSGPRPWDPIEPYHDRIRQAVVGHLDAARTVELHRALASAIEGAPYSGQDAMLAYHWAGAGRPDIAARHAVSAAVRAADGLAFDAAARFYRMALELGHPDRAQLHVRLGEVLGYGVRAAESAEELLAAAALTADRAEALELRRRAAAQLLVAGLIDRGFELLEAVSRGLGMTLPRTPRRALAQVLWQRLVLRVRGLGCRIRQESAISAARLSRIDLSFSLAACLSMVDTIRGASFQTHHLRLALRAGEPTRALRALCIESVHLAVLGAARRARAVHARAGALLAAAPTPYGEVFHLTTAGFLAYQRGAWREALALLAESDERIHRMRTGAWEVDTSQFMVSCAAFYAGELDRLARTIPSWLRAALERGDLYGATNLRVGWSNAAWLVLDEPETALRHAAVAEGQWTPRGFHLQHFHLLLARVNVGLYRGDIADAQAELTSRWADYEASLLPRILLVHMEALHLRARLAVAAGGPRALDEATRLARQIARCRAPHAPAIAELVSAGIAASHGNPSAAVHHLQVAIAAFDAAEMAAFSAVARRCLGHVLGDAIVTADADSDLARAGVRAPARFAAMLAPGFDRS
jgi:serine/threonine protein kinase